MELVDRLMELVEHLVEVLEKVVDFLHICISCDNKSYEQKT